jgi:hypothetical protein
MSPDHEAARYCPECSERVRFCEQLLNHLAASTVTLREFH